MNKLISDYNGKKRRIKKRLSEFRKIWKRPEKDIFTELCFCICTPQSKAVYCDKAITELSRKGILFKGNIRQVRAGLKAVRFPNNKSRFIIEARKTFTENGKIRIKKKIDTKNIIQTRHWLVKNVKGLALKEASHFLRNIGWGRGLAILDVHILKNMVKHRIIKSKPKTISEKTYLTLEKKLKSFSEKNKIPMEELDLLFWSEETGVILK
ncbi:MAG: N-glycosylase/DNA lyase [Candidatus Omnitrophota bacterium]